MINSFSPPVYHFENTEGDPFHVFPYTVEEISKCQKRLQHQVKDLPEYINMKINNIKNIIKKLGNSYIGIKTYH